MAMIMYCWHALKLEGVYRAVAYLWQRFDQFRYNMNNNNDLITAFIVSTNYINPIN
jgi:hypothetical protein